MRLRTRSRGPSPCAVLRRALRVGGLGPCLVVLACDDPRTLPEPDPSSFVDRAYPALLRDCAFAGCHGDPQRPLFVPGPGRTRLDPTTELMDPPTTEELQLAYDRARGLTGLVRVGGTTMPLLLHKTQAGAAHRGVDRHDRNVYEDPEHPGSLALRSWLGGGE